MEVLLVNTCATPLKLDGLQLQVQPQQPTARTQQQPGSTGAAATGSVSADRSSSSAVTAQQQQQQQRSVSVMLAAGSKPVRVLLTHVPSKAGYAAITGVQVGVQGLGLVKSGFRWDLLPAGHTKTQPPAVILPAAVKRWLVSDFCLLSCKMICVIHPAAAKATVSTSDTGRHRRFQDSVVCVDGFVVQAMCKGVSWFQPFVQLLPAGRGSTGGAVAAAAAVVAAAEGRDQSRPQGCFTVLVQPHLPLLKVGHLTQHRQTAAAERASYGSAVPT